MKEEAAFAEILEELVNRNKQIRHAVVVTAKGVVTRGARGYPRPAGLGGAPRALEDAEMVLLTAVLVNMAEVLAFRGGGDHLERCFFEHEDGYIALMAAGPKALLGVFQNRDVYLGLIFLECLKACKKIEEIIPEEYPDLGVPAGATGVREYIRQVLERFDATNART